MKKYTIFFFLILIVFLLSISTVEASYEDFEEVSLESGKFLCQFTDQEYKLYYAKTGKRRLFGWKVYTVNDLVPVEYKKETLFSYYNNGTTPFTYTYEYTRTISNRTQIKSTGNISISQKGSNKKFSKSLDSKISWDYGTTKEQETKEKTTLTIQIDPKTMVNLYISGKGYLTNGVAIDYAFFLIDEKGGFELFRSTTEYQRLEKVPIR